VKKTLVNVKWTTWIVMKPILFALCIFVSLTTLGATFQNLGFDEATTNNVSFNPEIPGTGVGPISELLPGWDLFSGTLQLGGLGYNQITAGLNYASVYDTNSQYVHYPIEGGYSLGLIPGPDFGSGAILEYTLSQTGEVPPDATSIRFVNSGSPFELRVNGSFVPLAYFSVSPSTSVVFGDVSAYSGQEVELQFTTVFAGRYLINVIDSVSFTIPEPTTWLLFGLGGLGLLARRKIFR